MTSGLSRMGMTIRLITLLLVLLFPYQSNTAADIALPEIGDSAGALVSPQEEYRIGQAFFWRLQQSVDLEGARNSRSDKTRL